MLSFQHHTTISLAHHEDCRLLGVTPDYHLYVEELYSEESWLAQRAVRLDGTVLESVDEDYGRHPHFKPLHLPPDLVKPSAVRHSLRLAFHGPRFRGLREPERIDHLVYPLTVQEKVAFTNRLRLNLMPPMLLGLAESCVLAEAPLIPPDVLLVCRRIRLAYALPQPRMDVRHQPYDYDTRLFYALHLFDRSRDDGLCLDAALRGVDGLASLDRPMDCLVYNGYVVVADGGEGDRPSSVHIWRIGKQ